MLQYWLTWVRTTFKAEEGQDLSEYALLMAIIAIGLIVVVTGVGGQLNTMYTAIKDRLIVP